MAENSSVHIQSPPDSSSLSGYSPDKSRSSSQYNASEDQIEETQNLTSNGSTQTQLLLEWSNIKYSVKSNYKAEEILKGVSGFANPKEVCVIMGASGAGKTTLLNILAGRHRSTHSTKISGAVSVNGQDIKKINYGYHSAYVVQDDILLPSLTVYESLMFSTRLRSAGSRKEHEERVDKIIHDLLLERISENIIGSVTKKGISGGERRRVCIGMELITDPHILILDEPTSGLDSWTADIVFGLLIKQAEKGRTVVTTIHQPSTLIFKKFNRLILLSEGYTIYQGSAEGSRKYFAELGYCCPKHINPPDYFMRLLHVSNRYNWTEKEKNRFDKLLGSYNEKQAYVKPNEIYKQNHTDLNQKEFTVGFITKFLILLKRSAINSVRNPALGRVKLIQAIGFAVIVDLIFNNLGHDYKSIQNRNGVLFELALTAITFGSQNASLAFPSERPLFLKEIQQRIYGTAPYYIAKSVSELPGLIFAITLQSLIVYWAIGLNNHDASKFFIFWIGMVLFNICGAGFGYLVGSIFTTESTAMAGGPLIVIPLVLFGGLFGNLNSMAAAFSWISYISPFKYGYEILAINEYTDLDLDCKDCTGKLHCTPCDPLEQQGLTDTLGEAFLGIILIAIVVRLLAYLFLLRAEIKARI